LKETDETDPKIGNQGGFDDWDDSNKKSNSTAATKQTGELISGLDGNF